MSEFNYPKFVLIKRTQVGVCIFNVLLTTVLAFIACNLANGDVDNLNPASKYSSLIKSLILRTILYSALLSILVNIVGIYASARERKFLASFYFILVVAISIRDYYFVLFEATSHRALYWFIAIWSFLNTCVSAVFWAELRKKYRFEV